MKKVTGNKVAIAIFVLPTLLLYTVLVFYPIIQTAIRSLYEWDGINIGEFVGLKHYIKLFTRDKTFKVSLINGLLFPLVTVVYQLGRKSGEGNFSAQHILFQVPFQLLLCANYGLQSLPVMPVIWDF